jgi:hypothetical protein
MERGEIMSKKKKKKYAPKMTAEEYENATGQKLGSLYNGSTSTVNNIDTTH